MPCYGLGRVPGEAGAGARPAGGVMSANQHSDHRNARGLHRSELPVGAGDPALPCLRPLLLLAVQFLLSFKPPVP